MICSINIKKYCKEDPSKIENYDKAMADEIEERLNESRASEIESDIFDLCYRSIRQHQEGCPPLIIYNYKKLLEIANEESLIRTTNYIFMFLSEPQQQDFRNKVIQLKEYKEWKVKNRINKLNEDF